MPRETVTRIKPRALQVGTRAAACRNFHQRAYFNNSAILLFSS
jgi:hypothetical protein